MSAITDHADCLKAIIANMMDHVHGSVGSRTAREKEIDAVVHAFDLTPAQAALAIDVTLEVAERDLWKKEADAALEMFSNRASIVYHLKSTRSSMVDYLKERAEKEFALNHSHDFTPVDRLTVCFYPTWVEGTRHQFFHNGVLISELRARELIG